MPPHPSVCIHTIVYPVGGVRFEHGTDPGGQLVNDEPRDPDGPMDPDGP